MKFENGNLDWSAKGGELRAGWNTLNPQWLGADEVLITIYGKISESFGAGDEIRFELAPDLLNELADDNYNVIPDAIIGIDVLAFSTTGTPEKVQGAMYNEQCKISSRPNPFSSYTLLDYDLPFEGHVTLEITDLLGRRVALLMDQRQDEGKYAVKLDATPLRPGVYMASLKLETLDGDLIKLLSW